MQLSGHLAIHNMRQYYRLFLDYTPHWNTHSFLQTVAGEIRAALSGWAVSGVYLVMDLRGINGYVMPWIQFQGRDCRQTKDSISISVLHSPESAMAGNQHIGLAEPTESKEQWSKYQFLSDCKKTTEEWKQSVCQSIFPQVWPGQGGNMRALGIPKWYQSQMTPVQSDTSQKERHCTHHISVLGNVIHVIVTNTFPYPIWKGYPQHLVVSVLWGGRRSRFSPRQTFFPC